MREPASAPEPLQTSQAFGFGDGDLFLATMSGFLEGDLHVVAQIVTALGLAWIAAGRRQKNRRRCRHRRKPRGKYSNGSWKPPPRPNPADLSPIESGMTILVVSGALLRIAQDFVGFAQFLETFLGGFVARVFIGMKLYASLR